MFVKLSGAGRTSARKTVVRCRKGAVAAEFAMIVPLMSALAFGTIEFGSLFFSYSAMQSASRDLARQVSVNTISVEAAESAAKARVPGWMRDSVSVSVLQSAPGNAAANVYTLRMSIPAKEATVMPFFTRGGDALLQTEVDMKQELPFSEPEEDD